MTLVAPRYTSTEKKQSSCAQWYIGSECTSTSSTLIPPSTTQLTYWLISDRLDSMTPLGRDSVPDVYMSRSGSSSPTSTPGSPGSTMRPCSSRSSHPSKSSQPSVGPLPIQPRTPPLTPAVASAPSAVAASSSSTTMPDAPAWVRMYAISGAVSMKLIGTSTTPSRAVANATVANCQQLCDSSASRSPLARPRSASACAHRLTAASNSANVSRHAPSTIASLSG